MHLQQVIEQVPDGQTQIAVFRGTQVPVKYLFEYLKAGDFCGQFLGRLS